METHGRPSSDRIGLAWALVWIVALAIFGAAVSGFDRPLDTDALFYATIGREIARTGDLWSLHLLIAGHPHLGLWALAGVFSVFPAHDWSARIVGSVFYVGFLVMFFRYLQKSADEKTAVATILLLCLWPKVSEFWFNVYLDPGILFFGSAAVFLWDEALQRREKSAGWLAIVAGIALGLAAMYKGLTVLGFLPTLVTVAGLRVVKGRPPRLAALTACLAGASMCVAGLYVLMIKLSPVPDFLEWYFAYQWTDRFLQTWDWSLLDSRQFWWPLLQDSYFLAPLALLSLATLRRSPGNLIGLSLFGTFVLMYAPADLRSQQYWILVFPWLAWLIAAGSFARLAWQPRAVMRISTAAAIVAAVFFALPRATGSNRWVVDPEIDGIRNLVAHGRVKRLILDTAPHASDFTIYSRYAWYVDVPITEIAHNGPAPPVSEDAAYVLLDPTAERASEVRRTGWCQRGDFAGAVLFAACGSAVARRGSR